MKSILVLEDDENLRETLVDVLDSLDYQVEGAALAEEALHLAQEISFDVVISDVRMAGPMDGLGALERLKQLKPSLLCIVMTGYADELAPLRALQIRVDDYLYKPFDVQDVVRALDRVRQSAEQNRWYRKALGRLFGQPTQEERVAVLHQQREECLKSFFVAVRSGYLYAETALEAWDRLEELELAYLSAMRTPTSIPAESAARATASYATWQKQLCDRLQRQEFVSATQRSPEKVDRGAFRRFLERIKAGMVTAEELGMAVCLRKMPGERRQQDPEYESLYQRMWGQ